MSISLAEEFKEELISIAAWWVDNAVDELNGGFVGEITVANQVVANANKGIILNARILWFFSEAALFETKKKRAEIYQSHAERAYKYIIKHFLDSKNGGVYWELNAQGEVVNDRKQIYAQAFTIYGLASYFKLTRDETSINLAYKIFELIESHSLDQENEGYIEAFTGTWGELKDFRLSEKDLNSPKSMNTHLHVLEAYTNLYAAEKDSHVGAAVRRCLGYFDKYIVNHRVGHLRMFQTLDWEDISDCYSYGHDIESSWLMWEAVEVLEDEKLNAYYRPMILNLAETCLDQAIGASNEVLDAYNYKTKTISTERVWWVQAEALVGFLTAFKLSGNENFKTAAEKVWTFIKEHQKDTVGGEWHWLSTLDAPQLGDCKIGFWKGPYHNGRAMIEAYKLVRATQN